MLKVGVVLHILLFIIIKMFLQIKKQNEISKI